MEKPSILIVEDDAILAMDLQEALTELGYEVVGVAPDGNEAIEGLASCRVDLVLMDIHLGGKMDGVETAAIIKREYALPVIYLTAHADDATLERAQYTEPYGYIVKPFEERELASMIKMALFKHRSQQKQSKDIERLSRLNSALEEQIGASNGEAPKIVYLGGEYLFDRKALVLTKGKKPVKLTRKEARLLDILSLKPGVTLPPEKIEQQIWEDEIVADGTLRSLIRRLRAKLDRELIENLPGYGYRLRVEEA